VKSLKYVDFFSSYLIFCYNYTKFNSFLSYRMKACAIFIVLREQGFLESVIVVL